MATHNKTRSRSTYDGFFHYLPVDDSAIDWGIYVTGAGRGRIHAGQPYPPDDHPALYQMQWSRGRSLPEFQVILITDGRGVFESKPTGRLPLAVDKIEKMAVAFDDLLERIHRDPLQNSLLLSLQAMGVLGIACWKRSPGAGWPGRNDCCAKPTCKLKPSRVWPVFPARNA